MDQKLTRKIGERLRAARHAHGLSLTELSRLCGDTLSKSRISNYEQGLRRPSLEAAITLADAFAGVSAASLLCLDYRPTLARRDPVAAMLSRHRHTWPDDNSLGRRATGIQCLNRGVNLRAPRSIHTNRQNRQLE